MKITHKLILLILLGFISNVIISILGLRQLAVTNDGVQYVMDNTLPSYTVLNSIDHDFMEARIDLRSHILTTEMQQKQAWEAKYRESMTRAFKGLDTYGTDKYGPSLISDDTDKQYYQQIRELIESYSKSAEDMLTLSSANKFKEAVVLLDKQADLASRASKAISVDVAYNQKLADMFRNKSVEDYQSARTHSISITVIMSLLLCGIGFFIYRQLRHGLNAANSTISRIQNTQDFTLRAEINGNDEISQMLRAFNQLISRMQTNLIEILAEIDRVTQTADLLQDSARRVSEGSTSQNASTSHMAASVEEMTVSINHVADQAKTTSDQSNEVGRKAEEGQSVIAHTVDNIHAIAGAVDNAAQDIRQLDEKGREIESVINIIRAVAEQTNLLALNAAIEAARAGEQGRGFAVVADEVRTLAARTATSTKEISELIKAIQDVAAAAVRRMQEATSKVEQGVAGASQANSTMAEICDVARHSVTLVADISNAIREQGAATNSIAQQVENVATMVNENTEATNQTSELASELANISNDMKRIVAAYHL